MIKYLEREEDFKKEIAKEFVLVDFYADWCGPCRYMGTILEEKEDTDILKVNVDNYPDIAKEYKVMSIPTLIIFKNGEKVAKNIGVLDKDKLDQWLNQNKN